MMFTAYSLYDIVEMKKPHPCKGRTKRFQIVMVGADIKIRCLGCGNLILMSRADFNERVRRVIESPGKLMPPPGAN